MFHILVVLTAKDEQYADTIAELMSQAAALSRQEPGCERYEVYHSQSDRRVFILTEWWSSEQAWVQHREERAFREIYQPQVLPLVDRVPHISRLIEPVLPSS